jgi:HEAT repeat protein
MSITPESIQELLTSDDLGERLRAVNQIRQLEPKIGFELIQVAIGDRNTRVRYSAISQLDTLGGQDLDLSLNILRDRLLNDPEPDVQAAAADCLGALKLSQAFPDLEQIYQTTSEWIVQFSIIATLGELGDIRAFTLLQQALASDNELIKTAAISSLGELGNMEAIPLLAPYVNNPDWQLRFRLVQALNRLGGTQAKSMLENLAQDEIEAVSTEAQRSLQNF